VVQEKVLILHVAWLEFSHSSPWSWMAMANPDLKQVVPKATQLRKAVALVGLEACETTDCFALRACSQCSMSAFDVKSTS